MENSSVHQEYINDPNFTLRFSNNKSSKRVAELVNFLKKSFQEPIDKDLSKPNAIISNFREHPEKLFENIEITRQEPEKLPPQPKFSSIRPFLFPSYPTNVHDSQDSHFEELRRQQLIDNRTEHHRMLWAFQDRLTRDVCTIDDKYQIPPLQSATNQIAKEIGLPIHFVEKRKEALPSRLSSLIKKSQKKAQAVLDNEMKSANILIDRKQFMINSDPEISPMNLPIVCPFSFLTEGSK